VKPCDQQLAIALGVPNGPNNQSIPNFFEEQQIAKIYGVTEDYTPPRRQRTAFMIYSEHKREEVLEDHPHFVDNEEGLKRMIVRAWAHLDNDQKNRFVEEANKEKDRYESELKNLPVPMYRNKRPRVRKDRRKPKKVLTPYMFYVKENRPRVLRDNPNMTFLEVMREVGVRWGMLSEEEKEPYKERSLEDKRRFLEETECFVRQRFSFPTNQFE
jgi:hypothetical protein